MRKHLFAAFAVICFGLGTLQGQTPVTFPSTAPAQLNGGITEYNGVSTVSNGVPAEYATVDLTAQGAALSGHSLYTPTTSGMYRISYVAKVTTKATTSSTLGGANGFQAIYTDADDSTASVTSPAGPTSTGNLLTTQVSGEIIVNAKAATAITFSFGYTSSGGTSMKYAIHVKVEAL